MSDDIKAAFEAGRAVSKLETTYDRLGQLLPKYPSKNPIYDDIRAGRAHLLACLKAYPWADDIKPLVDEIIKNMKQRG